jgi:hypothetical protein
MITTVGNTTYYSTADEWKMAGMPGGNDLSRIVIGEPPRPGESETGVHTPSGTIPFSQAPYGIDNNPSAPGGFTVRKDASKVTKAMLPTVAAPVTTPKVNQTVVTSSRDLEIQDYDKKIASYNSAVDAYDKATSEFENRWSSYIKGEIFTGSDADYKKYSIESAKLQGQYSDLGWNKNKLKALEKKLEDSGKLLTPDKSEKQESALKQLSDYGNEKDGYDLGKAIAKGVSLSVLQDAQFNEAEIAQGQKDAEYLKADGQGRFKLLQSSGDIPSGAKFEGMDDDGTIRYTTAGTDNLVDVAKVLITERDRSGFSSDTTTAKKGLGTVDAFKVQHPAEYAQAKAELQAEVHAFNKEAALSMVPIYGPSRAIAKWDDTTSTGMKVFDVATLALDVVTTVLMIKDVSAMAAAAKNAASAGRAGKVVDMIKIRSDQALGQIAKTDPELARALNGTNKAAVEYAKLSEDIARTEKYLKSLPKGADTYSEVSRSLDIMKSKLPALEENLGKAARSYADIAKSKIRRGLTKPELGPTGPGAKGRSAAATTRDIEALQDLDDLPRNLPRTIEQAVDRRVNPRTVKVIQAELDDAEAALSKSRSLGTTESAKLYDLSGNVSKLRSELVIAKAGDIQKLESEWRILKNETIPDLEDELNKASKSITKRSNSGKSVSMLRKKLQQAKLLEMKLQDQLKTAYRNLEEMWPAEPIPRGGGGGGVATRPRGPVTYGGGGGRVETGTRELLPSGARIISVDREGNITYVIKPPVHVPKPGEPPVPSSVTEAPTKPATRPGKPGEPRIHPRPEKEPQKPVIRPLPGPKTPIREPGEPAEPLPKRRPPSPPKPTRKPKPTPVKPEPKPGPRDVPVIPRPEKEPEPKKQPKTAPAVEPNIIPFSSPETTPATHVTSSPGTQGQQAAKQAPKTASGTDTQSGTEAKPRLKNKSAASTRNKQKTKPSQAVKEIEDTKTLPDTKTVPETKIRHKIKTTKSVEKKVKPPRKVRRLKPGDEDEESKREWTPGEIANSTAIRAGIGWWLRRGDGRMKFFKELPPGVKDVRGGEGSGYNSIQTFEGKPIDFDFKMGFQHVKVRKPSRQPGKRGSIAYVPGLLTGKRPIRRARGGLRRSRGK